MKLRIMVFLASLVLVFGSSSVASAHRSGCHSWHSCPSDTGSYTCGDTGRCTYCPNNIFCKNGVYSPSNSLPVVKQSKPLPPQRKIKQMPLLKTIPYTRITVDLGQGENMLKAILPTTADNSSCAWQYMSGNHAVPNLEQTSSQNGQHTLNAAALLDMIVSPIHVMCMDDLGGVYLGKVTLEK